MLSRPRRGFVAKSLVLWKLRRLRAGNRADVVFRLRDRECGGVVGPLAAKRRTGAFLSAPIVPRQGTGGGSRRTQLKRGAGGRLAGRWSSGPSTVAGAASSAVW